MTSKQGSRKRQLQERNFEVIVNHITINEDQLPRVLQDSVAALKDVFGHNMKKYSGTSHHKTGNEHVHLSIQACPCEGVCTLWMDASIGVDKLIRMQEDRSEAADAAMDVGSLQPLWQTCIWASKGSMCLN